MRNGRRNHGTDRETGLLSGHDSHMARFHSDSLIGHQLLHIRQLAGGMSARPAGEGNDRGRTGVPWPCANGFSENGALHRSEDGSRANS